MNYNCDNTCDIMYRNIVEEVNEIIVISTKIYYNIVNLQ